MMAQQDPTEKDQLGRRSSIVIRCATGHLVTRCSRATRRMVGAVRSNLRQWRRLAVVNFVRGTAFGAGSCLGMYLLTQLLA